MANIFKILEFTIDINPPGDNEDRLSVVDAKALTVNADDLAVRPKGTAETSLSDPQEYVGPEEVDSSA